MMQYHSVFSCVDHGSFIQLLEFFSKLCLIRQCREAFQNGIINLFGGIAVPQPGTHGNLIIVDTFFPVFTGHDIRQINLFVFLQQFLIGLQGIQILPKSHMIILRFFT